jgi:hypothetical protein
MKHLIFFSFLLTFCYISSAHAQQKKVQLCDGVKVILKALRDGKTDELKDTAINKDSFSSKIDIDELYDESWDEIGFSAHYKKPVSDKEAEIFSKELKEKLENCLNIKAKGGFVFFFKLGDIELVIFNYGKMGIYLAIHK